MTNRAFEHYNEHYFRLHQLRDSKTLNTNELMRDRAPRWLTRLPPDAHILDYGCADGYMLSVLHRLGLRHLVGADISESVLRHARDRLAGTTVDLRHLGTQTLDDCAGRFDAIVLHQVLEHIQRDQVIETLERLYGLLKPGGLISVAVPNASSLLGGFNHAIDFTHLISFNEYSLRQVLELAGFERTEIVLHAPRLFFSFRKPGRSLLRALNRVRYIMNHALHLGLYTLRDQHPFPKCFEETLEMLAYRPAQDG